MHAGFIAVSSINSNVLYNVCSQRGRYIDSLPKNEISMFSLFRRIDFCPQ